MPGLLSKEAVVAVAPQAHAAEVQPLAKSAAVLAILTTSLLQSPMERTLAWAVAIRLRWLPSRKEKPFLTLAQAPVSIVSLPLTKLEKEYENNNRAHQGT